MAGRRVFPPDRCRANLFLNSLSDTNERHECEARYICWAITFPELAVGASRDNPLTFQFRL